MRNSAKDNTRKVTALTLVVALGVAVYLNWEYARADPGVPELSVETSALAGTEEDAAAATTRPWIKSKRP